MNKELIATQVKRKYPEIMGVLLAYIKRVIKRLTSSHFIRNTAILMTGTAGSQALNFLVTPILSRIYTPEQFGVFLGEFAVIRNLWNGKEITI